MCVHPAAGLFAGAFIISFSGVFVKISQVSPMTSAFYRVLFGCVVLALACGLKAEFRKTGLKSNLLAGVCGLVFGLDLLCWHFSIEYIGPGLATILANFQVFILALAGRFIYKERLSLLFVLSLPMALAGLYMIIGLDTGPLTSGYLFGVGLGLLTALCYSTFLLLLRYVQPRENGPIFYYQVIVTASCAFCLGVVIAGSGQSFAIPNLKSLAVLLSLGGLCQALAWAMIAYCLPRVDASRAGLILLLQPALSFVWDVSFFSRQTGMVGWMGVAVVLAAIYMGMVRARVK